MPSPVPDFKIKSEPANSSFKLRGQPEMSSLPQFCPYHVTCSNTNTHTLNNYICWKPGKGPKTILGTKAKSAGSVQSCRSDNSQWEQLHRCSTEGGAAALVAHTKLPGNKYVCVGSLLVASWNVPPRWQAVMHRHWWSRWQSFETLKVFMVFILSSSVWRSHGGGWVERKTPTTCG